MFAASDQVPKWLAVLGVEELVREDESEATGVVEQLQPALNEQNVNIEVALAASRITPFVVVRRKRRVFLQVLNPNVRRISDDGVEAGVGVAWLIRAGSVSDRLVVGRWGAPRWLTPRLRLGL